MENITFIALELLYSFKLFLQLNDCLHPLWLKIFGETNLSVHIIIAVVTGWISVTVTDCLDSTIHILRSLCRSFVRPSVSSAAEFCVSFSRTGKFHSWFWDQVTASAVKDYFVLWSFSMSVVVSMSCGSFFLSVFLITSEKPRATFGIFYLVFIWPLNSSKKPYLFTSFIAMNIWNPKSICLWTSSISLWITLNLKDNSSKGQFQTHIFF